MLSLIHDTGLDYREIGLQERGRPSPVGRMARVRALFRNTNPDVRPPIIFKAADFRLRAPMAFEFRGACDGRGYARAERLEGRGVVVAVLGERERVARFEHRELSGARV